MSNDRDPLLESLFAESAYEPADDGFNAAVMAKVEKRRRSVVIGRVAIFALLIAFELLLSAPIQYSVGVMSEALSASLFDVNNEWLAVAVAPLNSVAGLVGIFLLGLHTLHRRWVR